MQGLADGYFILPYTIGDYLADEIMVAKTDTKAPEFEAAEKAVTGRLEKLFNIKGSKTVDYFHKKLGQIMWDHVGMARNAAGLETAIKEIKEVRADFWKRRGCWRSACSCMRFAEGRGRSSKWSGT